MTWRQSLPVLLILPAAGLLLRSQALLLLAIGLLAALAGAEYWGKHSLAGVRCVRGVSPSRAFPGDPVEFSITWENRKWLPLPWLESEEEVPAGCSFPPRYLHGHHRPGRERLVNLLTLRWYERVSRRFTLVVPRRGRYVFGPGELRAGDVFGFTDSRRQEPDTCELLVYPRLLPPDQSGLPTLRPLGSRRWGPPFFEDRTRMAGVREYQPGDGIGRVHWKATARTGELQVKVYEPSTALSLGIFLNCVTFRYPWQGVNRAVLERAVEVAASLAMTALGQGCQVGLYANGLLPGLSSGVHLPPASGPAQQQRILEALARVEPFGPERLADLLTWEGRRLPWGAAVVLVTAIVDEDIVLYLQELQRRGHPVALVAVGPDGGPAVSEAGFTVHRVDVPEAEPSREEAAVRV